MITAAGTDDRVAGLVYIAALAPDADETSQSRRESRSSKKGGSVKGFEIESRPQQFGNCSVVTISCPLRTSSPGALARMRSYEEQNITSPSRSIWVEAGRRES